MQIFRSVGRWIALRARHLAGDEQRAAALLLIAGFLITLAALGASGWIARGVLGHATQGFDEGILRDIGAWKDGLGARRAAADQAVVDVSALGGTVALTLLTTFATVYLALAGRRADALLVLVVAVGGLALNDLLKSGFARPRPAIFEHGNYVSSHSFPSGHSMMSMAIYLTHGVLLARLAPSRAARLFAVGMAVAVALAIGASRCYLGVHYPTDVAAGWLLGISWAIPALCASEVLRLDVSALEREAAAPARGEETPPRPHLPRTP